ncbi:MAG: thermonuclease family protein [Pseudomonadota bacterium]
MNYTIRSISKFSLIFLLGMTSSQPVGADTLPGPIPASVVRVVDGDTLRVRAKIWLGQEVEVLVRLAGIDAPETYRPDCDAEREAGHAARDALAGRIDGTVWLTNITEDKYAGRVVADARLPSAGSLSAELLALGHAVPMGSDGGWCTD